MLFLGHSMTSVRSGMNWSKKRGSEGHTVLKPGFSVGFAITMFLYIMTPMLPRLRFPFPLSVSIASFTGHRHIHCVTSPVVVKTRQRMFLFQFPFCFPFHPQCFYAMPTRLLVGAQFHDKSTKGTSSQDIIRHLIWQYQASSEIL